MKNNILTVGIITLFVISALSPIVFGYRINNYISKEVHPEQTQILSGPPVDSPWPMYCHDTRHTGRSPYNIADNPGLEKWRFDTNNLCVGSPVIDNDGTIYIGAGDFFAINPDGTLKWEYDISGIFKSAPAIDENGIIYTGSIWDSPNYMYAFYPDGTLKLRYKTGNYVQCSPAIGEDGMIYFGKDGNGSPPYSGFIIALHPNGTLKWKFKTEHFVHSSPAIGLDGTIYCGSHDGNLYALYPNNGTLKWKYKTGDWVARGPSIADDGTIYFGSWDAHLYACYPDGTLKWKKEGIFSTTPVIGYDGTIYGGYNKLRAINPEDGSTKWSFDPGEDATIRGGNPCISADGIIVFGTHIGETDGGELIAVNPDGTERWRIMLATDWIWSAPAIGSDGTIYVGSVNDLYHPGSEGYLHAIGRLDTDAPSAPKITGPRKVLPFVEYEYTFKSTSPVGGDLWYWIEWGDNRGNGWLGPYMSGEKITVNHEYWMLDSYIIKARCKDYKNRWSDWSYFELNNPRSRDVYSDNILNLLERFPMLEKLLNLIT
jgi:outer membrane protein assembly factor BamB